MEGPFTREMLPLAVPSGLAVRRTRTEDGFRDDPVAVRQLEVIRRLLREADGAVTATDTSREGQMVARNLYDYLGFKGKTERLWLSSLTDKAIREAFLDLRPDSLYEGLYLAVTRNFAASLFRNIKYFTLRKLYLCRKWMQKRLQKTTTTGITLPNFDFLA